MNPVALTLVLTGVLLNAVGQLALKASVTRMGPIALDLHGAGPVAARLLLEPALWLGMGCYAFSVLVWLLALSRVAVSVAYPMLSLGYVVNAVAAWWLFGEMLGPGRVLGIAVIILGVVILARA
jgi:multidrug transporter EmrE-like cation transporter